MNDLMNDLPTTLVIALCAVLIGWYGIGIVLNRRAATGVLRIIRETLPEFGGRANFRWRASSGVEVTIVEPLAPYTKVSLYVALEPREILILWLINHFIRGKRDQLIFRADLEKKPPSDVVVADPLTPLGQLSLNHAKELGATVHRLDMEVGRALEYSVRGKARTKLAEDFARTVIQKGWPLWVLSCKVQSPQIIVVCDLSRTGADVISPLFTRVRRLAREILKESNATPQNRSNRGSRVEEDRRSEPESA